MSLPIINVGAPGLVELKPEREYNSVTGWRTVRRWRGLDSAAEAFAPQLIADGLQFRLSPEDGPFTVVEAFFPDAQDGAAEPEDPNTLQVVEWELDGNDLEKDIFTHPKFLALVTGDQQALRKYRNDEIGVGAAPTTGDGGQYTNLITEKVEAYTVSRYVLRRSGTVPRSWVGQFVLTNVGKVYTSTAQLRTVEALPADFMWEMPAGEWLKRTPRVKRVGRNYRECINEWWHADYWAFLYDRVT